MQFHTKGAYNKFIEECTNIIRDRREVDFNSVIPMPGELLQCESGANSLREYVLRPGEVNEVAEFKNKLQTLGEKEALLWASKQYRNYPNKVFGCYNIAKYGFKDWYDWARWNWATKWNACDSFFDDSSKVVQFSTANNFPLPVMEAFAKKYCFTCETYDEDYNSTEVWEAVDGELNFSHDYQDPELMPQEEEVQ